MFLQGVEPVDSPDMLNDTMDVLNSTDSLNGTDVINSTDSMNETDVMNSTETDVMNTTDSPDETDVMNSTDSLNETDVTNSTDSLNGTVTEPLKSPLVNYTVVSFIITWFFSIKDIDTQSEWWTVPKCTVLARYSTVPERHRTVNIGSWAAWSCTVEGNP